MIAYRHLFIALGLLAGFTGPARAQSAASAMRANVVSLMREGQRDAAAATLYTQLGMGRSPNARDRAMAEEWLEVAAYFFNKREAASAEAAIAEAAQIVAGLKQEGGKADDALYLLYRNLGSLTETILHDRTRAVVYYNWALEVAAGGHVAASELKELREKATRAQESEAAMQARKKQ